MSTEITFFESAQFGRVRMWTDEADVIWFCGKDVCDYLEYRNITKAMRDHVQTCDMIKHATDLTKSSFGGKRVVVSMVYVNESGLNALVLGSTMPKAQAFKYWITSEVLPSIRQTGAYVAPAGVASIGSDMLPMQAQAQAFMQMFLPTLVRVATEAALQAAQEVFAEQVEKKADEKAAMQVAVLEEHHAQEVADLRQEYAEEHQYLDSILSSDAMLTITQIAMDYGITGYKMNEYLHDFSVQYKQNGQWLLYAEYRDKGYVKPVTIRRIHAHSGLPFTVQHTLWTQKGRVFIYNTLKAHSIYPLIER